MKNHPKRIARLFLIMAATATVSAAIAADKPVDVGKFEYESACASCHVLTGKGNGPLAMHMSIRTPDLTTLSLAAACSPFMIKRSLSRPRDRHDMTVPMGMPSVAAMSA